MDPARRGRRRRRHPLSGDGRSGVLFDIDGTLVDSAYLHALAFWQALDEQGRALPMARIHRLIGMGGDRITGELVGHDDAQLRRRKKELFEPLRPMLRRTPGAAELLRAVHDRGARVVLASSCSQDDLAVLRGVIEADDVILCAT